MAWATSGSARPEGLISTARPASTARPGDTVLAAVRLQMDSGWHTYWRNGGDSGGPTKIEWQLPAGVTAGDLQWPVPEKLTVEGLTTYIYHDEAVLLVPLTLAKDLGSGPLELKAWGRREFHLIAPSGVCFQFYQR